MTLFTVRLFAPANAAVVSDVAPAQPMTTLSDEELDLVSGCGPNGGWSATAGPNGGWMVMDGPNGGW